MIILHPSPARDYDKRRWDKWPALADAIVEKYGEVHFTGTEDQIGYIADIICQMRHFSAATNLGGAMETVEFMKFLSTANLLVTVNSMPMHAAMALNIPCVAIIGGTPASITVSDQCKKIAWVEDPALKDWDANTATYGSPKINEITVEQVMEKVDGIYHHTGA